MSVIPSDLGLQWRRMRFNPLRGLTPQILSLALDEFETGWLRRAALLWEIIQERDDLLSNVAPKRKKEVARLKWHVHPVDDSAEAATHAAALTEFWGHVTVKDATDGNMRGNLGMLVTQMMNARFAKYAVHEIVWSASREIRAEFVHVPLYFFENLTGRLQYVGPAGGGFGVPLPEEGWLITASDTAIMKAASICFMFKRLSLQDWLNLSEKFGIPGIHGKTPAAKGTQEFGDFVDALTVFANDWITATNVGAEIQLIEAKTQAGEGPFAPMVERMDRRMASLCRGSDLATISKENGTGASLQGEETDLLVEDDCAWISETLHEGVERQAIRWLFGDVEPMARITIDPPVHQDAVAEVKVDEFLLDHGAEMDAAEVAERYGRNLAPSMKSGAVLTGAAPGAANAEEPLPSKAANDRADADDAPEGLLQAALAEAMGVIPAWLAPVATLIADLEAKAGDKNLSDADLAAFIQESADKLPELFDRMDVGALADVLEAAMGTATIAGVVEAMRRRKK